MRKQRGITLIALVITIIVLLILAAVSITALTDEDKGVVTKAKQAASKTEGAADEEDADIQEIMDYADSEDWGSSSSGPSLASQIDESNYGDYVNYNKDLGLTLALEGETSAPKTDWRIFYKDGERVYLIAADYVPNTSSLLKVSDLGMTKNGVYSLYWESAPTTLSTLARQDSLFGITSNSYQLNSSYESSRCVSELLDTANWSNFVDTSVADYAIGGPTLEMYVNSWNAKGYKEIIPTVENIGAGYRLNGERSDDMIDFSGDPGFYNTLYYPHQKTADGGEAEECRGYWIAAPYAEGGSSLFEIWYWSEIWAVKYTSDLVGVRPVVSLKSGITAEQDANGVWQLN